MGVGQAREEQGAGFGGGQDVAHEVGGEDLRKGCPERSPGSGARVEKANTS